MRLLLVEDDIILSEVISEALNNHGYVVDVADNGLDGWDFAQQGDYAVLLLDWNIPKLDGVALCKRLRDNGCTIPILMMTARDTSLEKVTGLDAGADDYVIKPIDLPELLARIRALLRRSRGDATPDSQWGDLLLDPLNHVVKFRQEVLNITPKEFSLLELLLHNPQRVLSKQVIISHLWQLEDTPTEESVKAHIKSLRSKLKRAGAPADFIETVWGVGYRLKADE